MGERYDGLMNLFIKCSEKYGKEEIKNINFNVADRGNENENVKQYSMCYNKNNPNLKKYCGPDWVFYHWPSANIISFEETKNLLEK